jgi:hypothetical protein
MCREVRSLCRFVLGAAVVVGVAMPAVALDPWADEVVSYAAGSDVTPGYDDPAMTLGSPSRYTADASYPGAVTPFSPAWKPTQVTSIGPGGHLTVRFDEPITDDPAHAFGVDLLIFGNGSFVDAAWPDGIVGGVFEDGPFSVSVSSDGVDFVPLAGAYGDALFPTLGYLDLSGPYDPQAGSAASDFTKPVNPAYDAAHFDGMTFGEVVAAYDGSGGGIPIDLANSGLDAVQYVRIDVPAGATSPEIDGFAAVPEPTAIVLFGLGMLFAGRRR